tara:strand:+ start:327 stop:491 length:165 start_codon:yes stop_codon:yes gene_type:complete
LDFVFGALFFGAGLTAAFLEAGATFFFSSTTGVGEEERFRFVGRLNIFIPHCLI